MGKKDISVILVEQNQCFFLTILKNNLLWNLSCKCIKTKSTTIDSDLNRVSLTCCTVILQAWVRSIPWDRLLPSSRTSQTDNGCVHCQSGGPSSYSHQLWHQSQGSLHTTPFCHECEPTGKLHQYTWTAPRIEWQNCSHSVSGKICQKK